MFVTRWIAVAVLVSIFSTAFAAEPLFCTDPFSAVCEQRNLQETERGKRLKAVEDRMTATALWAVAHDFLQLPRPEKFKQSDLDNLRPKSLQKRAREFFFQKMRTLIEEYLVENEIPADLSFETIRESMIRIIWFRPSIPAETRDKIVEIIRNTHFVTLSELLFQSWNNRSSSSSKFEKECGWNGLLDNAFAETWNQVPSVIVCPGTIVASVEFSKHFRLPADLWDSPLAMTLGHELAHHFDWDIFPELYRGMKKCLEKHYRSSFEKPVSKYMAEIVADAWGAEVLADRVNLLSLPLREKIVTGSYEDLCGNPDDGVHPTGRFRIKILGGRSASVRRILDCSPSEHTECTLEDTVD
jgi:hypothetical protein